MKLEVKADSRTYPVYMERGILKKASEIIGRHGHVFLVSDDGVPEQFRSCLQEQYPEASMYVFENGEKNKNFDTLQDILRAMQEAHVSRKDTVIALGGGVVGDMAGFASAIYMRGISYINIPTTSLSQIDSGIGGKTAIDFNGVKNSVGAFQQPDMVLVDPEVLTTLTTRHLHNGLAEAVKEGLIKDAKLFELFESDDYMDHLDEIIARCLKIKKEVVENDEKETGERKLLNFGHSYGHAFEACYGLDRYYHGECVAMGMMTVLNNAEIKARLKKVLDRLELPSECEYDPDTIISLMKTDKKSDHGTITIVQVDEIGNGHLEQWTFEKAKEKLV
ncbi:MAG: 3-dehydroquinate synthase [Bulleidia sp.]